MKNPVIFVMARMGSSRLPGKVLQKVNGRALLDYQVERLRRAHSANDVVIATTTNPPDDEIVKFARERDITVFRGSEPDTIDRLLKAAHASHADPVIRVTGDCPLIDPATVDAVIGAMGIHHCDYVVTDGTSPRHPNGMGCEAFTLEALERFHEMTRHCDPDDAWKLIHAPESGLTVHTLAGPEPSLGHHRWTVDTPEDFALVSRILETIYPKNPSFGLFDIAGLMAQNPEWADINQHIIQKTGPHAPKAISATK